MIRTTLVFFLLLGYSMLAQPQAVPSPPVPEKMEGKPAYTLSGVQVYEMKIGTGKKAIPGFTLKMHYTGWYKKNKTTYIMFDSSRSRAPIEFDLGMRRVIKGWDEGLPGMRVGGKRQLIIPPDAAYGSRGSGIIPPNSTLIFEVELMEVR